MKTSIWILIGIAALIYSSNPTITFKPFNIAFEKPIAPFAIFFLVISLSLFQIQAGRQNKKRYFEEGVKAGSEATIEAINLRLKDMGSNTVISEKE